MALVGNFSEIKNLALKIKKSGFAYSEYHLRLLQSEAYREKISRDKGLSPQFLRALVFFGVGMLDAKRSMSEKFRRFCPRFVSSFFHGVIRSEDDHLLELIRFHIDKPSFILQIIGSIFLVSGWCVDLGKSQSGRIRIRIGKTIHEPSYINREEVAPHFSAICRLPAKVGFVCAPTVPLGLHLMWIDVESSGGEWVPIRRFWLLNWQQLFNGGTNNQSYRKYIATEKISLGKELLSIKRHIELMIYAPTFTIILDLRERGDDVKETICSITSQIYKNFNILVIDAEMAGIKKIPGLTIKTYSTLRECEVTGDFVIFMHPGELLLPDALYQFANILNQSEEADLIYGDQDEIGKFNLKINPFFKPDWSPDYLESFNYIGFPACYRAEIAKKLLDANSDYDFVLKFTEICNVIKHIPKVLGSIIAVSGGSNSCSNKTEKDLLALSSRLKRTGRIGNVKENDLYPGSYEIIPTLKDSPLISLLIPTAGKSVLKKDCPVDLVKNIIGQIRSKSSYKNIEIIVIDNDDLSSEQKDFIRLQGCRSVSYLDSEVNISKKMNLGASIAKGELLLLVNDDIEILASNWIEHLLFHFEKPHVGVVGAKLLYPDGKIQHAGVVSNKGYCDHVRRLFPGEEAGYFFSTTSVRNYQAVTGAVMLVRRKIYEELGGFQEVLPMNLNDIDFCFRVKKAGFTIVYEPKSVLEHLESASREFQDRRETENFQERWAAELIRDPYYNEYFFSSNPATFKFSLSH
jgi:GT2 family glycosyltransferase